MHVLHMSDINVPFRQREIKKLINFNTIINENTSGVESPHIAFNFPIQLEIQFKVKKNLRTSVKSYDTFQKFGNAQHMSPDLK